MSRIRTAMLAALADRSRAAWMVGLVAALIYANALFNRFAFDDFHIVVLNTAIQSMETLPGSLIRPYWPGAYGRELGLWRPVTTALLGVQHIMTGGAPWIFHVVNLLGHVLSSVLMMLLCVELMSVPAALVAGLVFAVHPVHVEAVANVVGLSEIVSTAALLGACLLHVRGPERGGWARALAVGALYAIGFGAKESAVTLPGLILLLDAARRPLGFRELGGYVRDQWRTYLSMLVVAAGMLLARYEILGSIANPFGPLGADLLEEIPRIWTVAEVWTHYVRLWVFPLDLSADYAPNVIPISTGWHATNLVGLLLALALLAMSLVLWRRPEARPGADSPRVFAFGIVWFVIAISPIANVFFLAGVLLAERTLYLPSVGLAAATGWVAVRLARERPRMAAIGLAAALVLGGVRTWTRTPAWRDPDTMLTQLLKDSPQSGRSQWIIGDMFIDRGRVSEGMVSYRAAIDLLGTHYQLITEISRRMMEVERFDAAEVLLEYAWHERPEFPLAPGMLATIRAEHGDVEGTERYARAALGLFERDPVRLQLLAWALAAEGRWPEAVDARRRADELGAARFWQVWMYEAYERREADDTAGVQARVDSAWAGAESGVGRRALDSLLVIEFGLESRLDVTEYIPKGS